MTAPDDPGSTSGEGTPSEDPYRAPEFGSQPPPYYGGSAPGAPPPPPPSGGAPPPYGQQPPPYGQPPAYGQPPQYGQSPPYGQPPPYGYTQPNYGYGAPPGYGPPLGTAVGCVASMGNRLGARIIDGLLVGAVALALIIPLGINIVHHSHTVTNPDGTTTVTTSHADVGALFAVLAIFAIIGILYEVGMIAVKGATLGKMAVGVKVIRADNGQVPGWGSSFVRWIIPTVGNFICGLIALLVYISPFFDGTHRNQGWHDKAAGTFVVRTR